MNLFARARVVAAVVLVLVVRAGGFQIISESPSIETRVVTDGPDRYTVIEGQTLYTVQCDSSDFGQTRSYSLTHPDGVPGRFNVTCGVPVNRFKLARIGYVPADAVLGTIEQCNVIGSSNTESKRIKTHHTDNELRWTAGGATIKITKRPSHYYRDDSGDTPFRRRSSKSRAPEPMFLGSVVGAIAGGLGAIGNAFGLGGGGGDCPSCASKSELDRLNSQVRRNQASTMRAMTDFMGQLNDVQTGQATLTQQLGAGLTANLDATNGLIAAALDQINMTSRLAEFEVQQGRQLDTKFAETSASIGIVSTAVGNLSVQVSALSNSVDAGVRASFNYTQTAVNAVHSALAGHQNITSDRINNHDRMLGDLAATVQTMNSVMMDMQRKDRDRAKFNRAVHTLLDSLEDDGWVPFLKSRGTPPSDDTSAFPYLNIAQVAVAWVSSSTAYKLRLTYNCGTRYLLDRADLQSDSVTVLRTLGPSTCNTADPDSCTCWVEANSQRCTKLGSYNFTSTTGFNNFVNATALGGTYCSGAVTTVNSEILTSGALEAYWLNGSYAPCASVPVATTGYAVTELVIGKRITTHNDPGLCVSGVFTADRALGPPAGAPVNPFMGVLSFMRMQRALAMTRLDVLELRYHGLVPDGITFETIPFTRRPHPDNASVIVNAACTVAHVSAYKDALPLYRMTAFATTTTVTSTTERFLANGSTVVGAASVKSVLLSTPLANLLPVSGKLVVGNPAAVDTIYDVPDADISAGSVSESNAGAVGYIMNTNISLLADQNAWIAEYGNVYDARKAVTAPEQYAVSINGTNSACVLSRPPGTGSLCDLRDNYMLASSTVNGTVYILASQRGGFYQAVISKPDGDLSSLVQSTCPTLSYGEITPAGVAVVLSVSSQLAAAVDVRVDVVSTECAGYTTPVTITPGTSSSVYIEACGLGGDTVLTVARLGTSGYEECPGDPFNATAPVSAVLVAKGIATTGHAVSVSTTNIDAAQVATQKAALDIAAMQAFMLTTIVDVFAGMEIQLPEESLVAMENALLSIRNSVETGSINTILGSRPPITTNFEGAANESLSLFNQQKNDTLARMDNVTASLVSARGILANFSVTFEAQLAAIAELRNLSELYANATRLLYESENARANATARTLVGLATALRNGDNGFLEDIFGGAIDGVSGIGRFAQSVVEGGVDVVKDVVNEVVDTVKDVAKEAKDIAGGVTGGMFGAFSGMVDALITIAIVGVCIKGGMMLYESRNIAPSQSEVQRIQRILDQLGVQHNGAPIYQQPPPQQHMAKPVPPPHAGTVESATPSTGGLFSWAYPPAHRQAGRRVSSWEDDDENDRF
jgi:hypothetical protein